MSVGLYFEVLGMPLLSYFETFVKKERGHKNLRINATVALV